MNIRLSILLTFLGFAQLSYSQLVFKPIFQQIAPEKFGVDRAYAQVFAKDGSLWAASEDGLLHYNGYSTKHFRHIPGDTNSVLDNTIFNLFQSSTGDFYIGYINVSGFTKYNPITGKFTHYRPDTNNRENSFPEVQIVNYKEDDQGNIWILTWGRGLVKFNPKTEKFKIYDVNPDKPNDPKYIPCSQVKAFTKWKDGKYLVGFFGGNGAPSWPAIFDPKTDQFSIFPAEEYLQKIDPTEAGHIRGYLNIVHFIHVDKNENIFFEASNDYIYPLYDDPNIENENNRSFYSEHAERRLIFLAVSSGFSDFQDKILVVTHFPCCDCARAIVLVGIKKVMIF